MLNKAELREKMESRKAHFTPMQEKVLEVIVLYVTLAAQEQQCAVILPESLLFEDIKHMMWIILCMESFMEDIIAYLKELGYTVSIKNDNRGPNSFYLSIMW